MSIVRGTFAVSITGIDLDGLPAQPVRVCVAIGNDRGSETLEWRESKNGLVLKPSR